VAAEAPELRTLQEARTRLGQRLSAVEHDLRRLHARSPAAPTEQALLERRLILTVALILAEQELRAQALELGHVPGRRSRGAEPRSPEHGADGFELEAALRVVAARGHLALDQTRRGPGQPHGKRALESGTFDFGDDLIEGELLKPQGGYLLPLAPAPPAAATPPPPAAMAEQAEPEKPHAVAAAPLASGPRPRGVGEARAGDTPLPEGVLPAVERLLPRLLQCLPDDVRGRGDLSLRVRARIDAEGRLRAPRFDAQEALGPAVLACLSDGLEAVRVPPLAPGVSHVVSFTVWLSPR